MERDLDITKFEFNMTDDEIRYFFADSTNDGGLPQSRQEDGLTHQVQEQLAKQKQVGHNSLKPLSLKATQVRFATPLNEHQMDQLRKSAVPDKTRAQTEWGVGVWRDWALARNCNNSDVVIPSEFVVTT